MTHRTRAALAASLLLGCTLTSGLDEVSSGHGKGAAGGSAAGGSGGQGGAGSGGAGAPAGGGGAGNGPAAGSGSGVSGASGQSGATSAGASGEAGNSAAGDGGEGGAGGGCGDGEINGTEACDGDQLGGADCKSATGDPNAQGTLSCSGGCAFDTSGCTYCGDGKINNDETCDDDAVGAETCASQKPGSTGTLGCSLDCAAYDTSPCTLCGNGQLDAGEGEQCDGEVIPSTCKDHLGQPLATGELGCTSDCKFDLSQCRYCSDSVINNHEPCDPGQPDQPGDLGGATCASVVGPGSSGVLGCSKHCQFNVAGCKPNIPSGDGTLDKGAPWPMLRGNPTRISRSPYEATLKTPSEGTTKTRTAASGAFFSSSPIIAADGSIYLAETGTKSVVLHRYVSMDEQDGEVVGWPYTFTPQTLVGSGSTPALGSDGTAYFGLFKSLIAVPTTGAPAKWVRTLEKGVCTSAPNSSGVFPQPVLLADDHAISLFGKWIFSVNLANNATIDDLFTDFSACVSQQAPAALGADAYFVGAVGAGSSLHAFSRTSTSSWSSKSTTPAMTADAFSSPVVAADGTVYLGIKGQGLVAFRFSIEAGIQLLWQFNVAADENFYAPAVALNGTLYAGTSKGHVYAINPDGTKKWLAFSQNDTVPPPPLPPVTGSILGGDGTLYVVAGLQENVAVYAIDPSNGNKLWSYSLDAPVLFSAASPAIDAKGTLYVTTSKKFYAFAK